MSQNEDPKKILRIVWFTCKELYRFVADVSEEDGELTNMKDTHFKLMDKVKNLRKGIREVNTTINLTKNMIQMMDDQLKEILETETSTIVASNYSLFKFKNDNKLSMKEFDVTTDKFKQFLKAKVPMASITLKSKNANSAFELKGFKWKMIDQKLEPPVLELVLVGDNKKKAN